MAKLTDEKMTAAFAPYLREGETLKHWAYGVKQPNMLLLVVLIAMAVLPGLIAVLLLTKNYLVGVTDQRLVVLKIKGMGDPEVKEVIEYGLAELKNMPVETSTGSIFTHIKIKDGTRPFVAKCHRAFSKGNRPHAMAICEAIKA